MKRKRVFKTATFGSCLFKNNPLMSTSNSLFSELNKHSDFFECFRSKVIFRVTRKPCFARLPPGGRCRLHRLKIRSRWSHILKISQLKVNDYEA